MPKPKASIFPFFLLLVCGGCAMQGSSERGLYPCPESSETPSNPPFDVKKAQAELFGPLSFGMDLKGGTNWAEVFTNVEIRAYAEVAESRENFVGLSTNIVAVVASALDDYTIESRLIVVGLDGGEREGFFLSAHGLTYGQRFDAEYSLTLINSKFEKNPLVLLFQNEGGDSRNFSYALYRIEDNDLRCLWKWDKDGQTINQSKWYSYSNLDFSGLTLGKVNKIGVYTTTGCASAPLPSYQKSSFAWSKSAQRFVPEPKKLDRK